MADKDNGRWEERVIEGSSSGVQLTVTRKGVEIFGWYDSFVGCSDGIHLTWADLEQMRARVDRGVR